MDMTKKEILRSYNEAKDKNGQITVLADLNCTGRAEIVSILVEMGVPESKLPKRRGRKSGTKSIKKPAEEETEKNKPDDAGDKRIILSAITRAAVEEENQIELLKKQIDQSKDSLKEHEYRLGVYSKYMKTLQA